MTVWHYLSDPARHNLLPAIPIHICFVKSSKALIKELQGQDSGRTCL